MEKFKVKVSTMEMPISMAETEHRMTQSSNDSMNYNSGYQTTVGYRYASPYDLYKTSQSPVSLEPSPSNLELSVVKAEKLKLSLENEVLRQSLDQTKATLILERNRRMDAISMRQLLEGELVILKTDYANLKVECQLLQDQINLGHVTVIKNRQDSRKIDFKL